MDNADTSGMVCFLAFVVEHKNPKQTKKCEGKSKMNIIGGTEVSNPLNQQAIDRKKKTIHILHGFSSEKFLAFSVAFILTRTSREVSVLENCIAPNMHSLEAV